MKKIAITKELLEIANELDSMKLFSEANTLTKIANIVVAEDYKHEPMVYNPDDAKADVLEAHSMDYLDAMEALNKLVESGELEPRELSQIQSILSDSDDEGPDPFKEMSYKDDKHHMTDEELDEQFDNDPHDMDDDDFNEEMMDEDPNAWMYDKDEDDDRRDKNHQENDGHYFFQDEDDF